MTGIIILPQRQTALVAKQAAEVDLLTGGRFRLGVGVGWNPVEYEALGTGLHHPGPHGSRSRSALLRRYWTERSVTSAGEFDQVTGAGIAPLPVQRPIPIWFGGSSPRAYGRMGRLADGWFPLVQPGEQLDAARALVDESALAAGPRSRRPSAWRAGSTGGATPTTWPERVEGWREQGATHLSINTMGAGLPTVDDHLDVLAAVATRFPLD